MEPDKDEKEGLKAILDNLLGPSNPGDRTKEPEWEIAASLGAWWRINYDTFMVVLLS